MIIFRADGNTEIGSGHIMRCLSIADAFKGHGEESIFAVADNTMKELIEKRGYNVAVLNTNYKDMLSDIEQTINLIDSLRARAVLVDSYYVTAAYLSDLKNHTKAIYIDDLASFAYPVDVLINYNIYADTIGYERLYKEQNVKLPQQLLGAKYVPLRAMFQNVIPNPIRNTVKNVLISTGGSDPIHLGIDLIRAVKTEKSLEDITFHFLIGALNSDKDEIERIAKDMNNVIIHYNVSDMKSLICSCDIAVSAAGSTLYEICACGVPLITYVLADNQIDGANAFDRKGLAVNCGDIRRTTNAANKIIDNIKLLSENYNKRFEIKKNMNAMINGTGAEKIVKYIIMSIPKNNTQ